MKLSQAKEYLPLIQAAAEGKTIQRYNVLNDTWYDCDPNIGDVSFRHAPMFYRIKPTPKLRPWTAEEVPMGAWLRGVSGGKWAITAILQMGIAMGSGTDDKIWTYEQLLKHYAYTSDGGKTWKPCGVETTE
jgi:hypothetical protein